MFKTLQGCIAVYVTTIVIIVLPVELISIIISVTHPQKYHSTSNSYYFQVIGESAPFDFA